MRRISAAIALFVAIAAIGGGRVGLAQDSAASYVVQIRAGTCATPGDAQAQLGNLSYPGDTLVGSQDASAAGSSYAVVPLSLDSLTGTATAVFVIDPTTNRAIACGEIGGVIDSNGALSIGLRPAENSGLSGIAYLSPSAGNPSQTGVSIFLADMSGGAAEAPQTSMDPAAYTSMVQSQVTILVGSLQRVDALFNDPQPDDSNWNSQVLAELFLWRLLYSVAQEATPPDSLAEFHQRYLEALSLLDSAAPDIVKALNTSDDTLLDQASGKIEAAVQALRALNTPNAEGTPSAGG